MAHSSNIIKKIAIGSTTYEIHDEQAIHTLADLAALGLDIEGAFIFKGTVATVADLPSEGNKPGYVYHVTANHSEYVWVKVDDATTGAWEEFGEHFVVDHIHSIPALSGSAAVTGTNVASTVSGSATASKASAGTAIEVAKAGTAKSVPNVTSVGSASSWSFGVSNGILTIAGANGTTPTLGTAISITPAVSNGSITPYTFSDVTVPKAATAATTVVTGVTTGTTNAATVGDAVTVATGSLASDGGGASVMTGLGTATTAKALTSASLDEATSADGVLVGDTVGISTESKTGTISGTAAQVWTQASGTVTTTASNTGNAKAQ